MFMWFSVTETYWWSGWTSIFICHLLMLTHFLCRKYSMISILVVIIYWCWLFFMCKMFLWFSTDVYVIFCYWNISMKCTHFILICHLLMLTFFYVQNVLIILNWCLCDFLVLKHIDEVDALHPHLSYTASDYLLMLTIFHVENVLIILDWCLCDFLLLKHIDEVDGLHPHLSVTNVDIFFHMQNVLIILDWCLCEFLLLKHIDEVYTLHLHLSLTDVDIFFVENILEFQ